MRSIHPSFNTTKVKHYVTDLIINYDYKQFSDLTYGDKCEFAALLIEAAGKDGEHECITESENLDQIIGFLKKALAGNYEDDENLLCSLRTGAVSYYENIMEALFYSELENYQTKRNEWFKYADKDETINEHRYQI